MRMKLDQKSKNSNNKFYIEDYSLSEITSNSKEYQVLQVLHKSFEIE